ncbi:MAG: HD domain-containing protein [Actinomycetota bacterium]
MSYPTTVAELLELYLAEGHQAYGEEVTSLEHALQCAAVARGAGASDELIAAALLHDVGHLVADVQGNERYDLSQDDDIHEAIGARVLSPIFGAAVAQPVSLHVTAKRWRCTVEPGYLERLSATSRATLQAQGGLLNDAQCERFQNHPGFAAAVTLREWDDQGKIPDQEIPALASYTELLEKLVR